MRRSTSCVLAVAVAACGTGGGEDTPPISSAPFCQEVMPRVAAYLGAARAEHPTPDDPRYGGTAVVGSIGELPGGMMSATSADYAAQQHQQFVNLMTLVDYDEEGQPRPYLAESFDVAEDGTSVTFHLRRDVFWHDGEATDAHDVAFTYEVVTDPATGFPNDAFWTHYVKGPEGVEVLDDYTVTIRLTPHQDFLDAFRPLAILPEHLLGEVPRGELVSHPFGTQCPVGNGPFVFREHRDQDRWVFEANPGFSPSLGGRPFLDRYVLRIIPEPSTLLAELMAGGIDVFIQPYPTQADEIAGSDAPVELKRIQSRQYTMVVWNARRPALADARVRRALTLGTDRARIVEAIVREYGTLAHTPVPPFHWAYDADAVTTPYDPDRADALLAEAGWIDRDGDGVRENAEGAPLSLTLKYPPGNELRQRITEAMQAQLRDLGVDLRVQVVEWSTMIEQIITPTLRDFDGAFMGWTVEYRLDDTDLFHSTRTDYSYAMSGIADAELDSLMEALALEADREAAGALWRRYEERLAELSPYTFFYFPQRLAGVSERLRDEVMDTRGEWLNVRAWHLDPESR